MLNGPALLRVFLVVIAAAVLTGLVQHYWILDNSAPEASVVAPRPSARTTSVRRADPAPARPPAPVPQPASPPEPTPSPQPAPTAQPAPSPAMRTPDPAVVASPETQASAFVPNPPSARPPPQAPASTMPVADRPETGEVAIAAAEAADPRAVDLADLNTGSLAELNGLKGGGAIGRAIIQHRPYASTDQLLSKRVLSRAIYQRIKDQVTVR